VLVLGISGGWDAAHAPLDPREHLRLEVWSHDSAAVLLERGELTAGIEEERLTRVKHTGHRPIEAIRFCCEHAGVQLSEVDLIACATQEQGFDLVVANATAKRPEVAECHVGARSFIRSVLARELGTQIEASRLRFVEHHLCHAVSAFALSGFENALVVTLDGEGDGAAGTVYEGRREQMKRLRWIPRDNSLGNFYVHITRLLGFRPRDEFKIMGLAPYGDPARFRPLFEELLVLEREGLYRLRTDKLPLILRLCAPRRAHEPIAAIHQDVAASLQEAIERAAMHMLRHFRAASGLDKLCLAGGVAQNCALTGMIERSGLFEDIFVCPASHDAGCAIGAAFSAYWETPARRPPRRSGAGGAPSVYLGSDIAPEHIEPALDRWSPVLHWRRCSEVTETAAELLASGSVVGWVQGRSEFGPRALGNRSILADPRPVANRERINAMVKKRESFRPFAPSVPVECAHVYFEIPQGKRYPYMAIVVRVRSEQRAVLGAVTHVDGTARLQTVSRGCNERYWRLLQEFGKRTGVPVLLNTSFNNNREPIVNSVNDGIVSFLTTSLDYLIVGDYVVSRASPMLASLPGMALEIPPHLQLREVWQYDYKERRHVRRHVITNNHTDKVYLRTHEVISEAVYTVLAGAAQGARLGPLLSKVLEEDRPSLLKKLLALWQERLICVQPLAEPRPVS